MGKKKEKDSKQMDDEIVTLHLSSHAKRSIVAILLFVIAVLFVLGFFHSAGVAGEKMTGLIGKIFGWGKYIAPLVFIFAGAILLRKKVETRFYVTKIIGISLAFWGILGLFHLLPFEQEQFIIMAQEGVGGGYLGYILANLFATFTGKIAGTIILLALILVGFVVAFNMSLVDMGAKKQESAKAVGLFSRKKKEIDEKDEETEDLDDGTIEDIEDLEEEKEEDEQFEDDQFDDAKESDEVYKIPDVVAPVAKPSTEDKIQGILDKKNEDEKKMTQLANTEWELPPLKLLERGSDKAQGGNVKQQAERIRETFENFGITMELEDIVTGPTVTQYSFRPQSGVKLTRITALNTDLALSLAAHPIRIEAPIPGKSLVGIEVPNKSTAIVRLRSLLNTDEFDNSDKKLLIALGEDVNGDYVFEDLATMPHLLVAGTTGAGKSVAINNILLSLLYKNSPDELKLILVDPKRVELSLYAGIPHLLSDVIMENGKVVNALKWTVSEMERRYKLLQETGAKKLASYQQKRDNGEQRTFSDPETGKQVTEDMENLPAIVIVIDELSALMSSHGKEVEGVIVRIAQMSRAVGIHLIISTQRPSVEVITGLIKANMPTRIALKVNSSIDSRTILDAIGAEKLIGNGDMLYRGPDTSVPIRLQNPFVEEKEIKKVINFIKRQAESVGAYDIDEEFDDGEEDHDSKNNSSNSIENVDFSNENAGSVGVQSEDPIYEEAKELVIEAGKASTSYIQRRLRVGYSRAARLMDELEDNGVISPPDGSKPRKILIAKESDDTQEIDEV